MKVRKALIRFEKAYQELLELYLRHLVIEADRLQKQFLLEDEDPPPP